MQTTPETSKWTFFLALLPLFTLLGVVITIGLTIVARRQAKMALAIQLHEFFLSPDFYAKVRAPAYHAGLQWLYLPEPLRQKYRDAVSSGWGGEVSDKLSVYVPNFPQNKNQINELHFRTPVAQTSLTEHQALSACLSFWSRLNTHIKLKTVNKKIVKKLFAIQFGYQRDFYRSLIAEVNTKLGSSAIPVWAIDILEIDNFFNPDKNTHITLESLKNSFSQNPKSKHTLKERFINDFENIL